MIRYNFVAHIRQRIRHYGSNVLGKDAMKCVHHRAGNLSLTTVSAALRSTLSQIYLVMWRGCKVALRGRLIEKCTGQETLELLGPTDNVALTQRALTDSGSGPHNLRAAGPRSRLLSHPRLHYHQKLMLQRLSPRHGRQVTRKLELSFGSLRLVSTQCH